MLIFIIGAESTLVFITSATTTYVVHDVVVDPFAEQGVDDIVITIASGHILLELLVDNLLVDILALVTVASFITVLSTIEGAFREYINLVACFIYKYLNKQN